MKKMEKRSNRMINVNSLRIIKANKIIKAMCVKMKSSNKIVKMNLN